MSSPDFTDLLSVVRLFFSLLLIPIFVIFPALADTRSEVGELLKSMEPWTADKATDLRALLSHFEANTDQTALKRSDFLKSELGQRYWRAKNFLAVDNSFRRCRSGRDDLTELLDRLQSNLNGGTLANVDCPNNTNELFQTIANVGEVLTDFDKDLNDKDLGKTFYNVIQEQALNDTLYSALIFERQFSGKATLTSDDAKKLVDDICRPSQTCSQEERRRLLQRSSALLATANRDQLQRLTPDAIVRDINGKVDELNNLLKEMPELEHKLRAQWQKEDSAAGKPRSREATNQYRNQVAQREQALQAELQRLHAEYQERFGQMNIVGAGTLMATKAMSETMGPSRLFSESRNRMYKGKGVKAWTPHAKIELSQARAAMDEARSRTREQAKWLMQSARENQGKNEIPMDNLKELVRTNPQAVGKILIRNPGLAGQVCRVAKAIALDERNAQLLDNVFLVVGVGTGAAAVATGFGAGVGAAIIGGAVAAAGLSAAEGTFQRLRSQRSATEEDRVISAVISGTGDSRSAAQLSEAREDAEESLRTSNMVFGVGATSFIGGAIRPTLAAARLVRIGNLGRQISKTPSQLRVVERFKGLYSEEQYVEFLDVVAKIPSAKRQEFLNNLSEWDPKRKVFADFVEEKARNAPDSLKAHYNELKVMVYREMVENSGLHDPERVVKARQILANYMPAESITPELLEGVLKAHHSHGKPVGGLDDRDLRKVAELLREAGVTDRLARRELIRRGIAGNEPDRGIEDIIAAMESRATPTPAGSGEGSRVSNTEHYSARLREETNRLEAMSGPNVDLKEKERQRQAVEALEKRLDQAKLEEVSAEHHRRGQQEIDAIIDDTPSTSPGPGREYTDPAESSQALRPTQTQLARYEAQHGQGSARDFFLNPPQKNDWVSLELPSGEKVVGILDGWVDPNKQDKVFVLVIDRATGKRTKYSVGWDNVGLRPDISQEGFLDDVVEEHLRGGGGAVERRPLTPAAAREREVAELRDFTRRAIREVTGPDQQRLQPLQKRLEDIVNRDGLLNAMNDPEAIKIQKQIQEITYPYEPLTPDEKLVFDALRQVPGGQTQLAPNEARLLDEAKKIMAAKKIIGRDLVQQINRVQQAPAQAIAADKSRLISELKSVAGIDPRSSWHNYDIPRSISTESRNTLFKGNQERQFVELLRKGADEMSLTNENFRIATALRSQINRPGVRRDENQKYFLDVLDNWIKVYHQQVQTPR